MGPTGVGKSTFIQRYTKNQACTIGNSLVSCTQSVTCYEATVPSEFEDLTKRRLFLVDTPGFDDTYQDDSAILKRVSDWLAKSYKTQMRVTGIVYVNDISQKRMFGSTRTNYNMFKKLCGHKSFKRLVMATSQWDLVESKSGEKREDEMKKEFWKDVLKEGAVIRRIMYEGEDLKDESKGIITYLLDEEQRHDRNRRLKTEALRIQTEVVDLQKRIPATKAGRELRTTLEGLLQMQKEMEVEEMDSGRVEDLKKKKEDLQRQVDTLQLTLSERIKGWLRL
ncbi:TKL/TKL-ccin protein kinase [Coprinopsis cinerea AmutBmut pab1-1]|nr:TKL/TKL-ccin protein kinase [Coprinopsis cinerea AmutBmut pab1-1]